MKKLLGLLLVVTMLFTFTACSDDGGGGGGSNSGFPTYIPDPDGGDSITELGFDYFITIRKINNRYFKVELLSLVEPEDCELRLNGDEMSCEWSSDDDYFWWFSLEEDELEGIDLNAGETIDYYLKINNKVYEGELEILAELEVDWPEFDFDKDFEFDWDIEGVADIYNILLSIGCEEDSIYEEFGETWQIDGNEDEFSISHNLYIEYEDCNYFDVWIKLNAINYINHGRCLAWSETDADYGGWNGLYKIRKREIDPKERMKRTIEMFKKKFDKNDE